MDIKEHYKNNYKNLCNVARRNVNDNSLFLAEECVQQAYTNLLAYIEAGNEVKEDYEAFIYRILFNAIHDTNNDELKRGMSGRVDNNVYAENTIITDFSTEDHINVDIFKEMCLNVIIGKFKNKNKKHETVLRLFFVKGYTHKEIGDLCGISDKTSRNIVSMYVKELKNE